MPLSLLTRLRGVIIVAIYAIALLWLEISNQMWLWATSLFLLPLLIWLLVSNAVKDAPPFDETAFHRTRPVSAGQVYRHLVGFHLLVLGGILLVVWAYVWRYNLGWREALFGTIAVTIPLIAVGSLFGATASLWTSSKHWKGWPFVTLLLIPAISLLLFFSSMIREPRNVPFATFTLAGAVIYPALWWLAAVKRRWLTCNVLGMFIGVAMPWASIPYWMPTSWLQRPAPERATPLEIQRLKEPANAEGKVSPQALASHSLEVHGLAPDEFIQVRHMLTESPYSRKFGTLVANDSALSDMSSTYFCTDEKGMLIPATASLLRVVKNGSVETPWWDNVSTGARERDIEDHMHLPIAPYAYKKRVRAQPSPEAEGHRWGIFGSSYRWVKILDIPATKGGRAKLPDGGAIRLLPLEESTGDFALTLRVARAEPGFLTQGGWNMPMPVGPAMVARGPDGETRFIELQPSENLRQGFLTVENEYEFRDQIRQSPGDVRLRMLRNSRIEVYWAESRGTFSATLPPPE